MSNYNNDNNQFNYQSWLEEFKNETWNKFQNSEFKENIFKNKTFKYFAFHYFSQIALNNGASQNLPFKTLSLLGEKLTQSEYKTEFQKIISQNVIKYKGQFYKLDDQIYQNRIQKAIKHFDFNQVNKFDKKAA